MLRKETQFKDVYVHWKREPGSYSNKRLMQRTWMTLREDSLIISDLYY